MNDIGRQFARVPAWLVALPALALAGCSMASDGPSVELKGKRFAVEIADEPAEQIQGLMFRRELASDRGMLFTYSVPAPQAYWMKNCYIPLDILYFDAQARFINGHYNTPPCNSAQCPNYPSERPAMYVLELAGGVAKAMSLSAGDPLTLLDVPEVGRSQPGSAR
jgi:uncharacterized membrane protein (UPF0127 family)